MTRVPPVVLSLHGRADVVADYDPSSGELRIRPRPGSSPFGSTSGWFGVLQGVCVVLYVDSGRPRLRVGTDEVPVDEALQVHWSARDGVSTVALASGRLDVTLSYPSGSLRATLLTPFSDEEDDDFGLFLSNVIRDPDRMARIVARVGRPDA